MNMLAAENVPMEKYSALTQYCVLIMLMGPTWPGFPGKGCFRAALRIETKTVWMMLQTEVLRSDVLS